MKYPIPKTQKQVKSFLGITNYHRKFIKVHAKIAKPLLNVLIRGKKINCKDVKYVESFNKLELIVIAPILAYPDFNQ